MCDRKIIYGTQSRIKLIAGLTEVAEPNSLITIGMELDKVIQGSLTEGEGSVSTVNLLVLTSLDQLLFILKLLFTSFTKQATLMRGATVLSLPLQLVFPGLSNPRCCKGGVELKKQVTKFLRSLLKSIMPYQQTNQGSLSLHL
jgi:hypothetical protein